MLLTVSKTTPPFERKDLRNGVRSLAAISPGLDYVLFSSADEGSRT